MPQWSGIVGRSENICVLIRRLRSSASQIRITGRAQELLPDHTASSANFIKLRRYTCSILLANFYKSFRRSQTLCDGFLSQLLNSAQLLLGLISRAANGERTARAGY
jgi:hypothetical protein